MPARRIVTAEHLTTTRSALLYRDISLSLSWNGAPDASWCSSFKSSSATGEPENQREQPPVRAATLFGAAAFSRRWVCSCCLLAMLIVFRCTPSWPRRRFGHSGVGRAAHADSFKSAVCLQKSVCWVSFCNLRLCWFLY